MFPWCFQWREIKLAVISHNFSARWKLCQYCHLFLDYTFAWEPKHGRSLAVHIFDFKWSSIRIDNRHLLLITRKWDLRNVPDLMVGWHPMQEGASVWGSLHRTTNFDFLWHHPHSRHPLPEVKQILCTTYSTVCTRLGTLLRMHFEIRTKASILVFNFQRTWERWNQFKIG